MPHLQVTNICRFQISKQTVGVKNEPCFSHLLDSNFRSDLSKDEYALKFDIISKDTLLAHYRQEVLT